MKASLLATLDPELVPWVKDYSHAEARELMRVYFKWGRELAVALGVSLKFPRYDPFCLARQAKPYPHRYRKAAVDRAYWAATGRLFRTPEAN